MKNEPGAMAGLFRAFWVGALMALLASCAKTGDDSLLTLEFEPEWDHMDTQFTNELTAKGYSEDAIQQEALDRSVAEFQRRLDSAGFKKARVQKGEDVPRVLVRYPDGIQPDEIIRLSFSGPSLNLHLVATGEETDDVLRAIETRFPGRLVPYLQPSSEKTPRPYVVKVNDIEGIRKVISEASETPGLIPEGKTIAFGQHPASSSPDDNIPLFLMEAKPCWAPSATLKAIVHPDKNRGHGAYCLLLALAPEDGERLGQVTQAHLGRQIAITTGGVVLSAPTFQSRVTANIQISGDFVRDDAEFLALLLSSGTLPVPLTWVSRNEPQANRE